jgi:uncharacterized repeat protein (TIGR03809 family)
MTLHVDVARGRNVVARWCNLAEQRLEYLTELFETGRWRRYHSELAFLENIQEAKAAVETWRDLLTRAGAPGEILRERVQLYQPAPAPTAIEPPPRDIPEDILAALESELIGSDEAPSAPRAPTEDEPSMATLDVMQERYPLLRNAL